MRHRRTPVTDDKFGGKLPSPTARALTVAHWLSRAQARKEGWPHGRPPTVRKHAGEIETLFADGVSKRQIAARLSISRASVRRMLALRRSVLRRSRPGVRERRADKS